MCLFWLAHRRATKIKTTYDSNPPVRVDHNVECGLTCGTLARHHGSRLLFTEKCAHCAKWKYRRRTLERIWQKLRSTSVPRRADINNAICKFFRTESLCAARSSWD